MQVLLLDEITVDMDVVGRLDLLKFFTEECEVRGATIIYATHIFDGLEKWVTHVAYLADGQLKIGELLLQMSGLALHLTEKHRATFEGVGSLDMHLAMVLNKCCLQHTLSSGPLCVGSCGPDLLLSAEGSISNSIGISPALLPDNCDGSILTE